MVRPCEANARFACSLLFLPVDYDLIQKAKEKMSLSKLKWCFLQYEIEVHRKEVTFRYLLITPI